MFNIFKTLSRSNAYVNLAHDISAINGILDILQKDIKKGKYYLSNV